MATDIRTSEPVRRAAFARVLAAAQPAIAFTVLRGGGSVFLPDVDLKVSPSGNTSNWFGHP